MRSRLFFGVLLCLGVPLALSAEDVQEAPRGVRLPTLVDTPTAEAIDHYGYYLSFRFYSRGGLLTQTTFGIFPRLNLGFGIDVERLIDSSARGVRVNRPSLNLKWRFFDGREILPAIALGYDSQGYFFDRQADHFAQRERGLYLVGTKEILWPGLNLSGGINTFKFSEVNEVHGFVSSSYFYRNVGGIMFEWDNVRAARTARYNLGFRFFVTPSFSVDFALRNGRGTVPPSDSRRTERVVQLNYIGSF